MSKVVCKIEKWHHLRDVVWKDFLIDDKGNVWYNGKTLKQFPYTVHFKSGFNDTRPYVYLPTERNRR